MDATRLKQQLENAKKLADSIKQQSRIFDEVLQETVKGVGDSDKPVVEQIQALSQRALSLAKQGKGEEAQQLIRNFKKDYGGKGNQ